MDANVLLLLRGRDEDVHSGGRGRGMQSSNGTVVTSASIVAVNAEIAPTLTMCPVVYLYVRRRHHAEAERRRDGTLGATIC
jgi:hypothetical protein